MRLIALLCAFALTAVACGGGEDPQAASPEATPSGDVDLVAQVASYDVAVGEERRIIVGLLTSDNRFVAHGEAAFRFAFLGTREDPRSPEPGPAVEAGFLPLPGQDLSDAPEEPTIVQPSDARGVYAAEIAFDEAGFWGVQVLVDVAGEGQMQASAAFQVVEETRVPAPGDEAPSTENLTMDSTDVPDAAIDSRAQGNEDVPDPELHETTIADAIAEGRPTLAIFSTPVYCVSRFCGPVTEMVEDLHGDYGEEMAFVHVEVWKDFQAKELNDAAAEWLQLPDGNLQEPWIFLIDGSGEIVARWDNVGTPGEIEPEITALLG